MPFVLTRATRRRWFRRCFSGGFVVTEGWWQVTGSAQAQTVWLTVRHAFSPRTVLAFAFPSEWWEGLTMAEKRSKAAELLDRARRADANGAAPLSFCDPETERLYPILHAFLSEVRPAKDGGGSVGWLGLGVEGGVLKIVLSDRVRSMCLWASGTTLVEAFECLEARLSEDVVDWRPSRSGGGKPK